MPSHPDGRAADAARRRLDLLTKPRGSLGALEHRVVDLAGIQGRERPRVEPAAMLLFASDHPVARHGVSAYPPEVTRAMLANFARGGAAASVLARRQDVGLAVVDLGVNGGDGERTWDAGELSGPLGTRFIHTQRLRASVAALPEGDLLQADALEPEAFEQVLGWGADAARACAGWAQVLLLGEIGIGNTTHASALCAALAQQPASAWTGPGTGLDPAGVAHKTRIIQQALDRAGPGEGPETALRRFGGKEVVAMVGAIGAAAQRGVPVLIDGFVVAAAAWAAVALEPSVRPCLIFGHRGAEPGHGRLLDRLKADPILDLGLRLGEGSGALLALRVLADACALHAHMATFEEAAVPDRPPVPEVIPPSGGAQASPFGPGWKP